jgi:hypothetical protein
MIIFNQVISKEEDEKISIVLLIQMEPERSRGKGGGERGTEED